MNKLKYLLFITLFFFGCSRNTTYKVTGVIKEIHIDKNKLLIDHDIIPGFMDPMVMFFNIHKNVDLQQFSINDSVKFDLVIARDSHYSLNFKILGQGSEEKDDYDFLNDTDDIYRAYKVGESLSNVSFSTTDNKIYNFSENISNKLTVISYIFSRCPMPDMCPAIISHNQFLADSFKDNPSIDFIIISFDFLYDTPDVLLNKYGDIERRHKNIQFLSSHNHYNDLVLLTKQSNLMFWGVEENNIGHTMRTIIIDKNNTVLKIYDGLDWKPGDVKKDIKNLLTIY